MAITLHIPSYDTDPLLLAETRPDKLEPSLSQSERKSPEDFANDLLDDLRTLNRQSISSNTRLDALEVYHPYVIKTCRRLAEAYLNSLLPLNEKARFAASMVESLWLELGTGYKLELLDIQNQRIKFGTEKYSATAIYRAIESVSQYKLVHLQTYTEPPAHIWSDLHQLYYFAAKLDLHKIKVDSPSPPEGYAPLTTIEDIYKHSMLISLAETKQLTQHDIETTNAYLTHHINHCSVTAISAINNPSGVFVIHLNSDKPPVIFSKQKQELNPSTDALLQTIDLLVALHQDLMMLNIRQMPENSYTAKNTGIDDYADLIKHLIKNWGVVPKRVFNRTAKNGDIELLSGLQSIHNALENASAQSSRWHILNISPDGMAARRHFTAEKNIRVGAIIAIKAENEKHWSLGWVRRASCGSRDRLDIGIQIIAPHAESVMVETDTGITLEALLLPEISAVNQPASIILPKDSFSTNATLLITKQNAKREILLTNMIERTQEVVQFEYNFILAS